MQTSTYLGYRLYAANITKSLQRTASEPVVARDTQYYLATIAKVRTVDEFVNNYRLFSYAMKAYGLDDKIFAKALMKKVLESDLSKPRSFANTLADPRYKAFAQAFGFTAKGQVANSAVIQSTDQQTDTLGLYSKATGTNPLTVAVETKYYKDTIGGVTSVNQLLSDHRLLATVISAYGIAAGTPTATLKAALESDLSDPLSVANTSRDNGLKELAADFNFAADGTIATQRLAQTLPDFQAMAAAYTGFASTDAASKAAAQAETTYVGNALPKITSLDALLADSRIVAYVGKAFGVASLSASTLRQVLMSDPNDRKSAANTLGERFARIAAAFEFTSTGTIGREAPQHAQTKSSVAAATGAYLEHTMETEAANSGEGVRLALYFRRLAPTITSAYQILADKALLKVVQTALGLPATTSAQNIDIQAKMIVNRLKIADLQDATKVDKFVSQFAALYDIANFSSDPSSSSSSTGLQLSSSVF